MDKFMREYKPKTVEPRVMFLSRWYYIWPADQEFAYAYHEWATTAILPFPEEVRGVEFRDAYEEIISLFNPHLLHLGPTYYGDKWISYDFLRRFREHKPYRKVVATFSETYLKGMMHTFVDLVPMVDILYVRNMSVLKELQELTGQSNVKFMPEGVDIQVYHPVVADKQIDLLFLGHAGGHKATRDEVIVKLDKEFDDLWVGGDWQTFGLRHSFGGAYKANFCEWNSRARIGLCLIPTPHANLEMYCPYRVKNTMATRTFALVTYTPGLENLFTRKVHLDWYESYEELVELIHYWLKHNEEREQVAQQGYEYVLENFTLRQQAAQILRDVGLM